jgi:hypothetical protein
LVPLVSLIIMTANAVMVARLPKVVPQAAPEADAETGYGVVDGSAADAPPAIAGRPASRNVGFFLTSFFDGILGTHQVLLLTVIPLWLVADTNSPHVLLAWLFATNTILAVLFQVRVSHAVTSVRTALRAEYVSAAFMVASCVIILATDHTIIWLTIPLVWLAHMTVTGAELFESSAQWGLQAELSDQRRLGDYQGIANLGNAVGTVWAPATYTYLATDWHTTGWLLIAAIIIVAAVAIRPAARLAERFLAAETAVTAGATAGSVSEHGAQQAGAPVAP